MSEHGTILVIDDEEIMREILHELLVQEGYEVRLASSGSEGLDICRSVTFDAAIVDIMMPDMDGISVLDELKRLDEQLPVLMITAFASVENAIASMKRGAFDYITKPFKNDEVVVVIRNAVERRKLLLENTALRKNLQANYNRFKNIVGRSRPMRQAFEVVIQAAPSRSTVLITGQSGTGKELVARAIHTNSSRTNKPFITVNSGSLAQASFEATLFGHVQDASPGATSAKKGLCDMADKGTIFFDEIAKVPLEIQAKLMRVIEEREFLRLGGMDAIKTDVRVIAATNCDLLTLVKDGHFREDLYYRLQVINIFLPPLHERKEDVPLLVHYFLSKYGDENNRQNLELSSEALDILMSYHWPGNVRELENVIERAVVLSSGARINASLIPSHVRKRPSFQMPRFVLPPEGIHFKKITNDFEKRLIESTLEATGGVQKRAADLLHVKPTTLNEMIKRHDINAGRKQKTHSDRRNKSASINSESAFSSDKFSQQ
tara:strand:+ start:765 stop:2237 length:1473 start_codon:yes stop_codon:yes gene_type:complete